MNNRIYLDYNATTPCDQKVVDHMRPFFSELYGNPSSAHHSYGWLTKEAIEDSNKLIANSLGVSAEDLIYTSGATESINMVLKSFSSKFNLKGSHIITCKTEHKAVLDTLGFMEKYEGVTVTYLDVDAHGLVDLDQLKEAVRPETILISIMHSNNETGVIQPLRKIRQMVKGKNIYIFSDATQSLGKVDLDDVFDSVDFTCFSAHKVYGAKGVGLVYVKNKFENKVLQSLIQGGGQQKRLRGGTLNTPGIAGFAKAIELSIALGKKEQNRLIHLRNKLESGLLEIEDSFLNGRSVERLPNTLNISFAYVDGFKLLSALSKYMAVSNGSACNSANENPSHVLLAMGLDHSLAFSSIRFSLGRFTTDYDIDRVIPIVEQEVAKQRDSNILWERRLF
ncbi:cysteine desulfurase family protein [Lutimonas vermicola]|uniref:Cysteine desulfurase family protein n=1 Tax=Lutimonas vermicola TaxID=414288 RepID=A0ABU9KWY7_9FLAO